MNVNLPDYVEILPDELKTQVSTNIDYLSRYELNPLLLTSYLLNLVQNSSNVYRWNGTEWLSIGVILTSTDYSNYSVNWKGTVPSSVQLPVVGNTINDAFIVLSNTQVNHTIVDFNRTSRINDTLVSTYDLYSPEIYKGFLVFKSTYYDLLYLLRQLGYSAQVVENAPSGLIDGLNDTLINGKWLLSTPNTILLTSGINIDPSTGQPFITSSSNNNCEVELIVNVTTETATNISSIYDKVARVLLNRLNILVTLSKITINLTIVDHVTNISDTTTGVYSVPLMFNNVIYPWKIGDGSILNTDNLYSINTTNTNTLVSLEATQTL